MHPGKKIYSNYFIVVCLNHITLHRSSWVDCAELTSEQMQHTSWADPARHLWFPRRLISKHTPQVSQWNERSPCTLYQKERYYDFLYIPLKTASEKYMRGNSKIRHSPNVVFTRCWNAFKQGRCEGMSIGGVLNVELPSNNYAICRVFSRKCKWSLLNLLTFSVFEFVTISY